MAIWAKRNKQEINAIMQCKQHTSDLEQALHKALAFHKLLHLRDVGVISMN